METEAALRVEVRYAPDGSPSEVKLAVIRARQWIEREREARARDGQP